MLLLDRLTQTRRPRESVVSAIARAEEALVAAAQHEDGTALNASPDRAAAALADAAVISILALHALGLDTGGHLLAACDRRDPAGRATRFTEAPTGGTR